MIRRDLAAKVLSDALTFPVVTVTGPRQSGKTTLVRACFPDYCYCNLERPDIRDLAQRDPQAFFKTYPCPVIIDEVQHVPELLSWIQADVDEHEDKGRYILTGSHQFRLHHAITQSLAGRTSLLRLLPFSLHELQHSKGAWSGQTDKNTFLLNGFMPRVYNDNAHPTDVYRNYFQTYVERDVRELINIKNITVFERFMRLLAARVGQVINYEHLSNDTGVSGVTIKEWISILEASYIIFTLPPYYKNFGKRLIRSPKIYFVEPGLATWLLGLETTAHVERDPLHGHLFENMVVIEAMKYFHHHGRDPHLYFWRDNNGNEVDLLWERQRELLPLEIKSSLTFNKSFLKGIHWFQKHIPDSGKGAVLYAGDQPIHAEAYDAIPFVEIPGFLNTLQNS